MGNVQSAEKNDKHQNQERPQLRDHGLPTWDHGEAGERNISSQKAANSLLKGTTNAFTASLLEACSIELSCSRDPRNLEVREVLLFTRMTLEKV